MERIENTNLEKYDQAPQKAGGEYQLFFSMKI